MNGPVLSPIMQEESGGVEQYLWPVELEKSFLKVVTDRSNAAIHFSVWRRDEQGTK